MLAEKWQKDLDVYQSINTTFIISGNVHDKQPWIYEDGDCETVTLQQYLYRYLNKKGYDQIVFYNRIDGFTNEFCPEMRTKFFEETGTSEKNTGSIGQAFSAVRLALDSKKSPCAIVVEMANTITSSPDHLSQDEIEYYTTLMLASKRMSQAPSMKNGRMLTNLLFLVVGKINDVPAWFYLNNPYVRSLVIGKPDKDIRKSVIAAKVEFLKGADQLDETQLKETIGTIASQTEEMSLLEIEGVFSLCRNQGFAVDQFKEAIRMFRYGLIENHWEKLDPDKVSQAEQTLCKRVIGQEKAVKKAAEVIRRAYLGLTGIQSGSASSKPKGVLFFSGPTGTGKTELAKAIAEFIFEDESYVTRFDMSEYSQPHSDQRLLGAPPGYVGYDAGGQLTNAMKNRPFSVLLFDEIDKAHPKIFDTFLQILDDGRITDSAGETMYFSEALIIFTSNLGVTGTDENGNRCRTVSYENTDEQNEAALRTAISDFFTYGIHREELLNRIGDNIVIFNYIRDDDAKKILNLRLDVITNNLLQEKNIRLQISDEYRKYLQSAAFSDPNKGGRGISNRIETLLINPLSDIMMKENCKEGSTIRILRNLGEGELPEYEIVR